MSNAVQTRISCDADEQRVAPIPDTPNVNTAEALRQLLAENTRLRTEQWPAPYNRTTHQLHLGDARGLSWIASSTVHLIVTSPPYWNLKDYNEHSGQLGHIADYERFLTELDNVWRECARVLVPGGRICCIVGDVCVPRRKNKGRHWVAPLHSDIQVRARTFGLDNLAPIIWYKIANGATETVGNGSGYYGKPYQPNGVIKNDIEYIQRTANKDPSALRNALSIVVLSTF